MIFENFLTQSSHFTGELEGVSYKEGGRREGLPRSGGIDKKNTIVANNNTKDFFDLVDYCQTKTVQDLRERVRKTIGAGDGREQVIILAAFNAKI